MKNLVIINEDHSLLPEQVMLLDEKFGAGNWKRFNVSRNGLTIKEIDSIVNEFALNDNSIVIASPIPALFALLKKTNINWSVFHNDNREKIELPNGKIIMKIAQTGWILV